MDFTVPIQKDTEREIFDYIDLESLKGSLQRINAKYEEEDLSSDVGELPILLEDPSLVEWLEENTSEIEANIESNESENSEINNQMEVSEGELENTEIPQNN